MNLKTTWVLLWNADSWTLIQKVEWYSEFAFVTSSLGISDVSIYL
jgi:hypothetical protein